MRPFLFYAVVRLGLWVLLWWLLTLAGLGLAVAGVAAALISMLLSILFLDRLRDGAALRWKAAHERRAERRGPEIDEDAEYEDAVLDEAEEGEGASHGTAADEPESTKAAGPTELPRLDGADDVTREDR